MNFFFGINTSDFISEIQIPTFQNRGLKFKNISLYKAFIKEERWNIEKLEKNQVDDNFYDASEEIVISHFEQNCIDLQKQNKKEYSMIELGSNQAYYSCLFKAILGNQ